MVPIAAKNRCPHAFARFRQAQPKGFDRLNLKARAFGRSRRRSASHPHRFTGGKKPWRREGLRRWQPNPIRVVAPDSHRSGALSLSKCRRKMLRGARAAGLLWTLPRVARVIEAHFGVKDHPGHKGGALSLSKCGVWAGVPRNRSAGLENARRRIEPVEMRKRSSTGVRNAGLCRPDGMEYRLPRRKRLCPPAGRPPYLGT